MKIILDKNIKLTFNGHFCTHFSSAPVSDSVTVPKFGTVLYVYIRLLLFCYFRVFVFGAGCIRGSLDGGQTREFSCRMLKSWSNRFPMAIIREKHFKVISDSLPPS